MIAAGGLLIYADKPAAGFTAMFLPLASLLGIFVYREVQSVRRTRTEPGREGLVPPGD